MARMWIVVGDVTSSGGTVVTGSPFTDIDGKSVARVGDTATCPKHKGPFPIVDGDATMIIDGQPVALHGSSLACGCKVLAVQQGHVFIDTHEREHAKVRRGR
ncbi:PAAR domain-containing protein [Luteimonas sp. R10]|uniref:PAAR domain-containing protein n=1 Tax=Luteimonas sp. R10 TaxID=3108176 RepID=UPI003088FA79|nr:PAAR domain-containing protein [Luteimonas sp. R10]